MAATAETTTVMYELEGTLLEACSCGVLCPVLDRRGPRRRDV